MWLQDENVGQEIMIEDLTVNIIYCLIVNILITRNILSAIIAREKKEENLALRITLDIKWFKTFLKYFLMVFTFVSFSFSLFIQFFEETLSQLFKKRYS